VVDFIEAHFWKNEFLDKLCVPNLTKWYLSPFSYDNEVGSQIAGL